MANRPLIALCGGSAKSKCGYPKRFFQSVHGASLCNQREAVNREGFVLRTHPTTRCASGSPAIKRGCLGPRDSRPSPEETAFAHKLMPSTKFVRTADASELVSQKRQPRKTAAFKGFMQGSYYFVYTARTVREKPSSCIPVTFG